MIGGPVDTSIASLGHLQARVESYRPRNHMMSIRTIIGPLVPGPIKAWRKQRLAMQDLLASVEPLHPRSCPVCGYHGFFTHFGRPPRLDARCPSCNSLERHRLFWLWFGGDKSKLEGPLLHFAPEPLLE